MGHDDKDCGQKGRKRERGLKQLGDSWTFDKAFFKKGGEHYVVFLWFAFCLAIL